MHVNRYGGRGNNLILVFDDMHTRCVLLTYSFWI